MIRAITGLALVLASLGAQAALLGRLPATPGGTDYQAVYDTDFNITWLANANLAASNTFGVSDIFQLGSMEWTTAQSWISAMNATGYLGVSDWRLPRTAQPDPTCSEPHSSPSVGYNCLNSEMGHLFYTELGGHAAGSLTNASLFSNLVTTPFYSSWSSYRINSELAIGFSFTGGDSSGSQALTGTQSGLNAWAVRDGDIAPIPLPAVGWLLAPALGVLGWMKRRVTN